MLTARSLVPEKLQIERLCRHRGTVSCWLDAEGLSARERFLLQTHVRVEIHEIGVVHVDVPQVGGQLGEFPFDVAPGAIPVDQGAGGESMTHVLQPGTTAGTFGWGAEAELLGHFGKGVSCHVACDPAAVFRDKERQSERCRKKAISGFGVLFQSLYSGSVNRNITRFSELRPSDMKDAELEVDIGPVQTQGFVHPHSCCYQQAEKGRIGEGAESLGRGELLSSAKEFFNLFVAIDVRGLASVPMRENPCGGNLGARFAGAMPNGEAPDHP